MHRVKFRLEGGRMITFCEKCSDVLHGQMVAVDNGIAQEIDFTPCEACQTLGVSHLGVQKN